MYVLYVFALQLVGAYLYFKKLHSFIEIFNSLPEIKASVYDSLQLHKLLQCRIIVVVIERKDYLRKHQNVAIKTKRSYINSKYIALKSTIKTSSKTSVIRYDDIRSVSGCH